MITLRIKSENGTLKCEYSEMEKPDFKYEFGDRKYATHSKKFESSFQPIKIISEEAREYLNEKENLNETFIKGGFELSGKETECFEVKYIDGSFSNMSVNQQRKIINQLANENNKNIFKTSCYYELHLKSVPVAENVVAGDGIKTAEEIFDGYAMLVHLSNKGNDFFTGSAFESTILEAMEEYASQYKHQHNHSSAEKKYSEDDMRKCWIDAIDKKEIFFDDYITKIK
jgi:hypothetical protein